MKLKVLELFGGIGACSKALERLKIPHKIVDYVEIDKYAVKSFNAIHNTNFEPQDICKWDKDIEVDLIMHGSPCQDFSLAGKQAGGDKDSGTRSSLMYETIRIVEKLKPKYVIWENVKNLLSKKHRHNFDAYLETMHKLGYTSCYQVLNAKDYGIPQNRERVFTVSIRYDVIYNSDKLFNFNFPPKQELKLKLKDMLEDEVDEKYYLSDKMIKYISATGTANFKNPDCKINLDIARPLTTDQNKRAGTTNYLCDELPPNYDLSMPINKPKVLGGIGEKKSNGGTQWYQQDRIYDDNIAISITTAFNPYYKVALKSKCKRLNSLVEKTEFEEGKVLNIDLYNQTTNENISQCLTEPHHNSQRLFDGLRIRKLTPKECWRLMGFDDEDFEKAAKVNSNTQLYKQAGNSIVVNVLEAILKNLLF
jgi:DNA (cytosine-5)-methyltransferase 1